MLKRILFTSALLLPLALSPLAYAQTSQHETITEQNEADLVKELEYKLKSNKAFLKAAHQVVDASKDEEALSYLKMAESAAKEGTVHYNSGEYKFGIEDISESTQMAIHSIILAKNQKDNTIRDFVIQEEILLRAKRDKEHKEMMIKKGQAEVEIFIKTAERLLEDNNDEAARAKLKETIASFEASKANLLHEDYDTALEDINKAYKLATHTVKDIKRSKGEIITFPKKTFLDEKEQLEYEIKKNNTYVFFASRIVKDGNKETTKTLKAAKALKEDAAKAIDSGETKKAIDKLKESTNLYINALKQ
ncbi:MAG: hypothetical protein HYS21_12555 [Deltaproteobacteria bacterium]|nr:hypothetical protein [Deltaproteobacteria bacterium]